MGGEVDEMLGCLLGTRAGAEVVPRDLGRFCLLEHRSEPGPKHGVRGERANDLRPILDPDGVSNKSRLGLHGNLGESEAATCELASIGVRDDFPMPQVVLEVAELAEAESGLTVTQTPFVVPRPLPLSLFEGRGNRQRI